MSSQQTAPRATQQHSQQPQNPDADTDMLDQPPPEPAPAAAATAKGGEREQNHSDPAADQLQQEEGAAAAAAEQAEPQPNPSSSSSSKEDANPAPAKEAKEEPEYVPPAPGPRAARLQALFASTAAHTLDKISKDNFAACFPTIAARAPGTLEFVQRQMVERLGGLWKVCFILVHFSFFFLRLFFVLPPAGVRLLVSCLDGAGGWSRGAWRLE